MSAVKHPEQEAWYEAIADLDEELRAHQFSHGPDRWQAAYDLILRLYAEGREPKTREQWRAYLGPIFCRTESEQKQFAEIFENWWESHRLSNENAVEPAVSVKTHSKEEKPTDPFEFPKWRIAAIIIITVVVFGAIFLYGYLEPIEEPELTLTTRSAPAKTNSNSVAPPPEEQTIEVAPIPARQPIEQDILSPSRQRQLEGLVYALPVAPLLIFATWLAILWLRRRWLLERSKDDPDSPLKNIRLEDPTIGLLDGPEIQSNLAKLHQAVAEPSRRLHADQTVEHSARQVMFKPIYAQRQRVPIIVVLIETRGEGDHRAGLAETLLARLKKADLVTSVYYYRDTPRYLFKKDDDRPHTLAELATRYQGERLLIIGQPSGFINVWDGQLLPWIDDAKDWQGKALLSAIGFTSAQQASLGASGFLLATMDRDGLNTIFDRWLSPENKRQQEAYLPSPLPRDLDNETAQFDEEEQEQLLRRLRFHLGEEGFLLLSAVAAYPQMHWGLTQVLDYLLFKEKDENYEANREHRLLKIIALPWSHEGWLPEWLRERLLSDLDNKQWKAVKKHYQDLFSQEAASGDGVISLPFKVPKSKLWFFRVWLSRRDTLISDDVLFARVLLGKRPPKRKEFPASKALSKLLRGQSSGWLSALRSFAFLLVLGVSALLYLGMQAWGRDGLNDWFLAWQHSAFSSQQVRVHYQEETFAMADGLRQSLLEHGFQVDLAEGNVVTAAAQDIKDSDTLEFLQDRVIYSRYGQSGNSEIRQSASGDWEVDFTSVAEPGLAVFKDELSVPFDKEQWLLALRQLQEPEEGGVEDEQTANDPPPPVSFLEPEMIRIEPGSFQMGDLDGLGNPDERPFHRVNITYAFEVGKYEVTFDEYDLFARVTGRNLPSDLDWGRGNRPVINVSWDDATAYAQWLSSVSGKQYRLLTEAEWEYVGRAGTTTSFSFGDCVNTDQANYDGSYDYRDCRANTNMYRKQTLPVDDLVGNPWGLYHVHGNVWEWVQDCWHENYENAPMDGAAWLDVDGADCSRRVLRGGGWIVFPSSLRSAFRFNDTLNAINNFVGFRLARSL